MFEILRKITTFCSYTQTFEKKNSKKMHFFGYREMFIQKRPASKSESLERRMHSFLRLQNYGALEIHIGNRKCRNSTVLIFRIDM